MIERAVRDDGNADAVLTRVRAIVRPAEQYVDGLRNCSLRRSPRRRAPRADLAGLLRDVLSDHPGGGVPVGGFRQGRIAGGMLDDLVAALAQAIEELTPPCRCDQAPGEDRDGRHRAATRRDRPAAGAGRARRRGRPRRAQLQDAGAGRPRPGGRRGPRVYPLRHRGRDDHRRRCGGLSMGLASASSGDRSSRAPSAPWPQRELLVARGRGDGRTVIFVPEVKANVAIPTITCTSASRTASARRRWRRAPGLRPPLRPPRRLGQRDRGGFDDRLLGELPGRRPAHRADLRRRRQLAVIRKKPWSRGRNLPPRTPIVGSVERASKSLGCRTNQSAVSGGSDVPVGFTSPLPDSCHDCRGWGERGRHRAVPHGARAHADAAPAGVHRSRAGLRRIALDPVPSLATGVRCPRGGDEVARKPVGAFGYHDVSVHIAEGGAPSLIVVGKATKLAEQRRVVAFHLSLSHDGPVALAVVVADERGARRLICRVVVAVGGDSVVPIPVVTPAEMAAIDAAATETVETLIGRAGAAVAHAARRMLAGAPTAGSST